MVSDHKDYDDHSDDEQDSTLYDYIVVIDAGSNGSRAHLYRSLRINGSGDEDTTKRDWKEELSTTHSANYPTLELIKSKKVKPGIATFYDNTKKLGKHYMGKLLESMEDHIPKSQIERTPIFLHATGGMRLLRPEQQSKIFNSICEYVKDNSKLYLPDCSSHINAISGETEGLYAWLGLNYRYGVFDPEITEETESYGILDMGGVSSQIAFEPSNSYNNTDILFKIDLDYTGQSKKNLHYSVFSQSLLSGMHQAHIKYDEKLLENNSNIDPCLPTGYVKTVTTKSGLKSDIEGSGDFKKCITSLFEVLEESTIDKYCDPNDNSKSSSCLLSDEYPKMDFNYHKFIGINEIYSNLKKHVNYKEFYENTEKICETSFAELLKTSKDLDKEAPEKVSELCFKSTWIINALHHGVNFPRYGIDELTTSSENLDENFKILDEYSWTLGRAVLYSYYEAAQIYQNTENPKIGYYEPSSKVFIPGGEAIGISSRPAFIDQATSSKGTDDDSKGKIHQNDEDDHDDDHDEHDDDDKSDDDWDDVFEEHRLWGSLLFLLILVVIGYLLMGKTKRQSIKDAFKRVIQTRFRSTTSTYFPVQIRQEDLDLELGGIDELANENNQSRSSNKSTSRDDSFEIE